jgi:hypothetical protein
MERDPILEMLICAVETILLCVGFDEYLQALCEEIIELCGRDDRLAFLANANPNLTKDVVETYKELFHGTCHTK